MPLYRHLKDAVLDLDHILIRTMSGFSIEETLSGFRALFEFAFYGPNLDDPNVDLSGRPATVSQYPNIEVFLPCGTDLEQQIRELSESEILGELYWGRMPPNVRGNDTDAPKWVVRTHAGSQAEHIEWLRSIG